MNADMLVPFIQATRSLFETMLQLDVTMGDPEPGAKHAEGCDVSGIIGFTGDMSGSVVVSFPRACAHRLVSIFTGVELEDTDEALSDAVGELTNIIAGGTKAKFDGAKISISCPSVIMGKNHNIRATNDTAQVSIPCSCDCGDFALIISVKLNNEPAASGASGAAAQA